MQGILCLILVAVCLELSSARLKTAGVMARVWPRTGHHQSGFSATLHHKAEHPSRSNPSPLPCTPELRCSKGMNPHHLEASVPTRKARSYFPYNIKISAKEKSLIAVQASWGLFTQALKNSHHKIRHGLARNTSHDPQSLLNTAKHQRMLRRWWRGSPRAKRSVTQGTAVQYTGFKDVKFRRQGPHPLYLTPASSGNSLCLSNQHHNHSCFRAYMFREITANRAGGLLVMLQAHTNGYLQANSSGFVSLVNSEAGAATVTQVDSRFFRLTSCVSDTAIRIKHIITNLHLQARGNGVSLVNTDPLEDERMLFYEFSCSTS